MSPLVMVFVVNSLYQKREVIAHFFANSLKLRLLIRKSDSRLDTTHFMKEVQFYEKIYCNINYLCFVCICI